MTTFISENVLAPASAGKWMIRHVARLLLDYALASSSLLLAVYLLPQPLCELNELLVLKLRRRQLRLHLGYFFNCRIQLLFHLCDLEGLLRELIDQLVDDRLLLFCFFAQGGELLFLLLVVGGRGC